MNPDDVIQILHLLSKDLEPGARYVFDLAVKQIYIDFLIASLLFFISVGGLIACCVLWAYHTRKSLWAWEEMSIGFLMTILVMGILSVTTAVIWLSALAKVLNPEFNALLNILGRIH